MTHDEIVSEVQAAGIDLDSAATRISRWLNNLCRDLAAFSGWIKGTPELATTVANQDTYTVPDNVVRVLEVRGGGATYVPVGIKTAWDLKAAVGVFPSGSENYFAEQYDDSGQTKQIVLYPAPSQSGLSIEGFCTLYPGAITQAQEPPFPREYDMALIHGCIGIGLRFGDEDHASAEQHKAIYESEREKLRRQANVRLAGRNQQAHIVGLT